MSNDAKPNQSTVCAKINACFYIFHIYKELDLSATFESISSLISKCKLVYKKVLLLGVFFLHIFASVAQPCFLNICFGLWL